MYFGLGCFSASFVFGVTLNAPTAVYFFFKLLFGYLRTEIKISLIQFKPVEMLHEYTISASVFELCEGITHTPLYPLGRSKLT